MSGARLPVIPENITVHLGPASSAAPNVTVPFSEYIKNVASSEIYPTWPESAIRANILAQISFALNRIYTEYYRSRGKSQRKAILRELNRCAENESDQRCQRDPAAAAPL